LWNWKMFCLLSWYHLFFSTRIRGIHVFRSILLI